MRPGLSASATPEGDLGRPPRPRPRRRRRPVLLHQLHAHVDVVLADLGHRVVLVIQAVVRARPGVFRAGSDGPYAGPYGPLPRCCCGGGIWCWWWC